MLEAGFAGPNLLLLRVDVLLLLIAVVGLRVVLDMAKCISLASFATQCLVSLD
jgi:hypothetical protein